MQGVALVKRKTVPFRIWDWRASENSIVVSGNVASKKIYKLKDICWVLAGSDDNTKDVLIVTIKTHLADHAVQSSLKFFTMYACAA